MEIFIILCLILINGFLSMSEIALVSARKSRLEAEANAGNNNAHRALELADNPDRFLSTIQIGITLIGIITGLYSGDAFAHDFAIVLERIHWLVPYSHTVARVTIVAVVTYLSLVFGELVPKRIGMGLAERISKLVAGPMNILSRVASPFVWLLSKSTELVLKLTGINTSTNNKVTEEEIRAIIWEGYKVGEVQEVEQDIMGRVFTVGDRNAGSIMTHRNEMIWLRSDDTPDIIRSKVMQHLFNSYPVTRPDSDTVIGVVSIKDLFGAIDEPDFNIESVMKAANFIPEKLSVYNVLEQFRQANVNYGLITDEFGSIEGIVTFKDIVEALVGQVPGVEDELEMLERSDGSWLVDGQISFYQFLEHFDDQNLYMEYDHNTLSGLILEILEHVPVTGETFNWKNYVMEIVDMDGARIDKVLVRKLSL